MSAFSSLAANITIEYIDWYNQIVDKLQADLEIAGTCLAWKVASFEDHMAHSLLSEDEEVSFGIDPEGHYSSMAALIEIKCYIEINGKRLIGYFTQPVLLFEDAKFDGIDYIIDNVIKSIAEAIRYPDTI